MRQNYFRHIILCLCLLAGINVKAARVVDGINYEFDRTNMQAWVVSENYSGSIVIPETITVGTSTFTVVGIGNSAFEDCRIYSISLPETLLWIDDYAFEGCDYLTSITLPDNIKSIGKRAFYWDKRLSSLTLPDNEGITFGQYAFVGLSSLQQLTIPDSWTTIPAQLFESCGIMKLSIGRNVRKIGARAFIDCNNLAEIYCKEDCVLDTIMGAAFAESAINSMEFLPSTIRYLDASAFYHCKNISEIRIPASVEYLGGGFLETLSTKLVIEDSPKSFLFMGRSIMNPTTMYLGRPIDMDSSSLPYGSTNLKRITFGPHFEGGDEWQFGNKLEIIYAYMDNPEKVTCHFNNNVYDNAILYVPVGYLDAYMATDNFSQFFDVREFNPDIPANDIEFADATVKSICVKNWDKDYDSELSYMEAAEITDIENVFYNKDIKSFDEFQFFTGLKSIPEKAFAVCSSLTSIVLPEGLESIKKDAFRGCTSLSCYMDLPNKIKSIEDRAFLDCSSLKWINMSENSVESIGYSAFASCSSLTSIDLPEGLTTIAESAFAHCTRMTSISLPATISEISSSFSDCSSVKKVVCHATTVPTTNRNAFYNTPIDEATLYVPAASLDAYKSTEPWSGFGTIVGLTEDEIDAVEDVRTAAEDTEVARYDVQGRRTTAPQKGINIIRYSDGTNKKVLVK